MGEKRRRCNKSKQSILMSKIKNIPYFWKHFQVGLTFKITFSCPSNKLNSLFYPRIYLCTSERGSGFPCIYPFSKIIRCHVSVHLNFFYLSKRRDEKGNMFSLGLCLFLAQDFSFPVLVIHKWRKKCITADQMGTFHMTKPINHFGGTQVWHSRTTTHHFTVYQAQTHGNQSMAPWGPMWKGASP